MNDYKFGNFVCMLREKNGMTQAELSQVLQVTPAAVSKWENGESKPRIETLFKLAQILGVTAEELIAGEFITPENRDSAQDEEQRRRELFLSQADNLLTVPVRLRRTLAECADMLIAMSPMFLLMVFSIFRIIRKEAPEQSDMLSLLFFAPSFMLLMPLLYFFRDIIGGGRSLGCRLWGLIIINENTGEKAHTKQLLLRNLCFFIGIADEIVMLVTGRSIGDRVGQTLTVSKKQMEELKLYVAAPTEQPPVFTDPKKNRRSATLIAAGYLIPILIFVCGFISLHYGLTHSEHYNLAYDYLVNSESFQELKVAEDSIINNVNSLHNGTDAEHGFIVGDEFFTVICHKKGDTWTVCKDCTEFD